jgi:hypothetical protein
LVDPAVVAMEVVLVFGELEDEEDGERLLEEEVATA